MTEFNEEQSYAEGWLASTCSGSAYFPEEWMQIERFDERDRFESDWEALAWVAGKAALGSEYHQEALEMIEKHNFNLTKGYKS
jgi:hypothetical protein